MSLSEQERRCYELAAVLHSLVIDGKLDAKDFEDILSAMGVLKGWKYAEKRTD